MSERFICYADGWPYRVDEFVLRDQPAGILDKVFQDREALGPQLHLAISGANAAAPEIEREPGETEHFLAARLHQSLLRT